MSWHHAAFHRAGEPEATAELHAATLDPASSRAVHEAEELLKQWWSRLQPLYPALKG
ncbi:hypothetical protein [Actinacidiphila oryziradicis]|uniref:hypothetical protein n=1 Tax=Actinacidiphila oryziradicis TaxID=2571141 RepID=UPI0023EF7DF4|nr:hypothetical protein [Actinacidiphila oryziradicis]